MGDRAQPALARSGTSADYPQTETPHCCLQRCGRQPGTGISGTRQPAARLNDLTTARFAVPHTCHTRWQPAGSHGHSRRDDRKGAGQSVACEYARRGDRTSKLVMRVRFPSPAVMVPAPVRRADTLWQSRLTPLVACPLPARSLRRGTGLPGTGLPGQPGILKQLAHARCDPLVTLARGV